MIITKKWIHAHKTPGGAWNRKQIEALGLAWPARKGWIKDVIGTEISNFNRHKFEVATNDKPALVMPSHALDRRFNQLSDRIELLEAELKVLRATI